MEMAEHEARVPLMDTTLNMMMFADDIMLLSTGTEKTFRNSGRLLQ